MNNLPRDKQIEIVSALTEGMSIRAVERLTGVHYLQVALFVEDSIFWTAFTLATPTTLFEQQLRSLPPKIR